MSWQGNAAAKSKVQGRVKTLRAEIVNAYDVAVKNGFEGTEEEWLESLQGRDGCTFIPCVDEDGNLSWSNDGGHENPETVCVKGFAPVKGVDYFTEADKKEFEEDIKQSVPMVLHDAQDLTDEQKLQARMNIGATGTELAEEVLATIPKATDIQFLQAGDVVQMRKNLADGRMEITQIHMDALGIPTKIETDGTIINLSWEGFD